MNVATISIGFLCGLVAAMLFGSVASGSGLSIILFYIAILPVMIAGLGWRHSAAGVAAVSGSLLLVIGLDTRLALLFLFSVGLPGWLVAYLCLLARPIADGVAEWYPLERVLMWIGAIAFVLTIGSIPVFFGLDFDAYQAAMRKAVEAALRIQFQLPKDGPLVIPGIADPTPMINLGAQMIPALGAVTWVTTTALNLYLAGRIVRTSGRLIRPWPMISAICLPRPAGFMLLGAFVLCGFDGYAGHVGLIAFMVLLTLMVLDGLALIHAASLSMRWRDGLLLALYALLFFFGFPALLLALIGLGDVLTRLHDRLPKSGGDNFNNPT